MANTYTRLYVHIVFAVQNRISIIQPTWKDQLYRYISGIVQNNQHKLIIINGTADHVHVLIGYKPHQLITDLVKQIKGCSSKWINDKRFVRGKFRWQEGYGAFSCSHIQLAKVIKYIKNQEAHHRIKTFRDEYLEFLNRSHVAYIPKYVLKDIL